MPTPLLYNAYNRPVTREDYRQSGVVKPYDSDERKDVEKFLALWQNANTAYRDSFQMMKQCMDVLNDKQWTQEELDYAEKKNRTLLTINITRPFAMQVVGMQRMARSNLRVEPFDRIDDPKIAEIAQKLLESIEYNSRSDIRDALVFQDGLSYMGNWEIYIDYNGARSGDALFGDVKIGRCEPRSVLWDPDSYDPLLNDCLKCIRLMYMRPDKIKEKFGKGAELDFSKIAYDRWYEDLTNERIDGFEPSANPPMYHNGKYLVGELYERSSRIVRKILNRQTGEILGEYPFEAGSTEEFMMMYPDLTTIEIRQTMINTMCIMPYYYTRLFKTSEDYECYPIVPFLSVRNGDRMPNASSYNASMLGLQTELNVRHSNQQEYVVKSLRGGYWIFDNTGNETLLEKLDEFGHETGRNYLVGGPPGSEPKPIMPADILRGEAFLEEGSLKYFELVTGLTVAAVVGGIDDKGESGVKRKQRREESQTTLFQIIDDFNHSNAIKCEAALERQMSILNPMKAVRIIGKKGDVQYMMLTQEMIQNARDVRRWDIRVLDGPYITSRVELDNDKMGLLYDTTAKVLPEAAQAILPRLWRNSGIEDAEEIAAEVEKIIVAKATANIVAPPEINRGSSGEMPPVA